MNTELDLYLIGTIGAIVVLLFLSFFFSGSETALTAASRPRMHQLSRQKDQRADTVLYLHDRKDRLIGAILLGNNLVNILASALATSLFLNYFGEAGVVYATVVMTLLVLVFAEVLPKSYALSHADRTALVVAPIIKIAVVLFSPVTIFVNGVVQVIFRLLRIPVVSPEDKQEHREEELRGAIELHEGATPEAQHERQMLRSILELDEVEVAAIMTHRRNVTMIDASGEPAALVDEILASPFTRLPLYRGDPDEIVAVLHVKALLRDIRSRGTDLGDLDIAALATPPWFIPDTTSLLDQLQAFRERREHFAIVIDEYGAFLGIVTLEDILEEIVGSIEDEHDIAELGVRALPDGGYIVPGTATIRDLNRELDWDLPDGEAATLAGLVLHEARLIPDAGQVFSFFGFRFEILKRVRNQIVAVKVTPPATRAS